MKEKPPKSGQLKGGLFFVLGGSRPKISIIAGLIYSISISHYSHTKQGQNPSIPSISPHKALEGHSGLYPIKISYKGVDVPYRALQSLTESSGVRCCPLMSYTLMSR